MLEIVRIDGDDPYALLLILLGKLREGRRDVLDVGTMVADEGDQQGGPPREIAQGVESCRSGSGRAKSGAAAPSDNCIVLGVRAMRGFSLVRVTR